MDLTLGAGRIPHISSFAVPDTIYVDETPILMVTVENSASAAGDVVPQISQAPPNNSALRFTSSNSATFQADLRPIQEPGEHTISVIYAGQTRLGQEFSDTRTATIVVQQYAWVIWSWRIFWTILLLVLAYILFKFVLIPFSPLIWASQKIGVSPEGYIRIQRAGDSMVGAQNASIGDLLRRHRKLRKITLGPDGDIKLREAEPALDAPMEEDDDLDAMPTPKKPKQRFWEKILRKPKLMGIIDRQFRGPTILRKTPGATVQFSRGIKETEMAGNTIEYSSDRLDS
jgi:hypothetical protein